MFGVRVKARMVAALEQSAAATLPTIFPESTMERAIAAAPEGTRLLLDPTGRPLLGIQMRAPMVIAVGPEGGLEDGERGALHQAGFVSASLGENILRFETAAIAALAIVRVALTLQNAMRHGE
jgi:16S rRNA (uracil1498-N3)-methyltransferase